MLHVTHDGQNEKIAVSLVFPFSMNTFFCRPADWITSIVFPISSFLQVKANLCKISTLIDLPLDYLIGKSDKFALSVNSPQTSDSILAENYELDYNHQGPNHE